MLGQAERGIDRVSAFCRWEFHGEVPARECGFGNASGYAVAEARDGFGVLGRAVGGPEVLSVAGVGEEGGDGWGGDVVYLVGEVVVLGARAEVLEDGFADEGVLVGCGTGALGIDEEVDVDGGLDVGAFLDYEVLML